jgi:hypothetical protein
MYMYIEHDRIHQTPPPPNGKDRPSIKIEALEISLHYTVRTSFECQLKL